MAVPEHDANLRLLKLIREDPAWALSRVLDAAVAEIKVETAILRQDTAEAEVKRLREDLAAMTKARDNWIRKYADATGRTLDA